MSRGCSRGYTATAEGRFANANLRLTRTISAAPFVNSRLAETAEIHKSNEGVELTEQQSRCGHDGISHSNVYFSENPKNDPDLFACWD